MKRNVFRNEVLNRISTPDQLHDYIRVTNPALWMMMCAILLLLIGICAWGFYGHLDTMLPVAAVTEDGKTICYVKEKDMEMVNLDMKVRIGEEEYHVQDISLQPVQLDEAFDAYLLHVGGLLKGEWVYAVTLDRAYHEEGRIAQAQIVVESVAPVRFILN